MFKFPRKSAFLHVSPWLFAAAAGLLVLIVVTFGLNNFQREKRLMTDTLLQKSETIMRIVHSGARAAHITDLKNGRWGAASWNDYAQGVMGHVAENPDIHFLAIVDEEGVIIAHSLESLVGEKLGVNVPLKIREASSEPHALAYTFTSSPAIGRVFVAARLFVPHRAARKLHGAGRGMHHRLPLLQNGNEPGEHPFMLPGGPDPGQPYFIVTGLDTEEYDQALRRLRLQIIILSLTMLLVGVGGWLSLSAVQGYRVSQKTLREVQAFTGHLVARLPVGIVATDKSGMIKTWNSAAAEMIGPPGEKAMGKRPAEVLPPRLAAYFSERADETGSRVEENTKEDITTTLNGREQVLQCHAIAVRDTEANYIGRVLLLSNLTELKNLEKEMREHERLAAVGRMAGGVAHEVRNPLSSIKGLALLLKGKFATESKEYETATLLIREVERMNRTISELLSFTRPLKLKLQPVNMAELLEEQMKLIGADALSSGVAARLWVTDDLREVAGDRDRLKQVFINILLNAIQAMEGGGELRVNAQNSEGRATITVIVEDTGCGIDEQDLAQVFYPYFTTKPGGTGIGLAISQKIVSDHRGTIKVDSEPGRGTKVVVELPVFSP